MFDMVYVMLFFTFGLLMLVVVKRIIEWGRNNASPRLSVNARIVNKRMETHHNHDDDYHHDYHTYHITFEVQSGDRMQFRVSRSEFGLLIEGDEGVLYFQGTRYLGFERMH